MPPVPFNPSNGCSLSSLEGLSILITGGASGLGASTARFIAKHGARVTVVDLKDGSKLVAEITQNGGSAQYVYCDITDYESQTTAFESAISFSRNGELDAVLAFAGVDDAGPLVDYVASSGERVPPAPSIKAIDVNLKGTLYTTTLALHYLRSTSSSSNKSFLIVSSMAAYVDDTHDTSYTASKFGLRGLFRSLRRDADTKFHIRINALCPWAMRTPMTEPILAQLAAMGIEADHGNGITLVTHEVLTQAAAWTVVDRAVCGRAIAIMPEGSTDLGDDLDGVYAGPQLVDLMKLRREAGDFLSA